MLLVIRVIVEPTISRPITIINCDKYFRDNLGKSNSKRLKKIMSETLISPIGFNFISLTKVNITAMLNKLCLRVKLVDLYKTRVIIPVTSTILNMLTVYYWSLPTEDLTLLLNNTLL